MKKTVILLMFLSLFLIGCGGETTTEVTTTEDTNINTEITAPVIAIQDNEIYWVEVVGVDSYEVLVKDVTTDNNTLLLENAYYLVTDTSFFIDDLEVNRIYEISVRSVVGEEHSLFSNIETVDKFVQSDVVWQYTFNRNSTDFLIVYDNQVSELYFIEEDGNKVDPDNYHFELEVLMISPEYILEFSEGIIFKLYTEYGIIDLEITFTTATRPFIRSNNTVEFANQDMMFVFELCGGEFVEIDGSDITEDDYDLFGNILVLHADFIQELFDANPDRNSVILSYQLKNGDEIVIGYLFINRPYSLE